MAKTQKTLLLNDQLLRLADAQGKRTGASFTRIVTAAMLQYLFTHPDGPEQLWMEHAVALELGEITVGDLPAQRMNDLVAEEGGWIGSSEIPASGEVKELDPAQGKLYEEWRSISDTPCKDPVEKIIFNWGISRKR